MVQELSISLQEHPPELFVWKQVLAADAYTLTTSSLDPQSCWYCTGSRNYCSWKGNHSSSLGVRINSLFILPGTEKPWQIYGEHRHFLECCIPGKPSSTWFDSNNNSFAELPSVNRVGWTTFSSCFYFKPPCAGSALSAVSERKCLFAWSFFPLCFSTRAKVNMRTFCWALFLSLFYLCNWCQWKH